MPKKQKLITLQAHTTWPTFKSFAYDIDLQELHSRPHILLMKQQLLQFEKQKPHINTWPKSGKHLHINLLETFTSFTIPLHIDLKRPKIRPHQTTNPTSYSPACSFSGNSKEDNTTACYSTSTDLIPYHFDLVSQIPETFVGFGNLQQDQLKHCNLV